MPRSSAASGRSTTSAASLPSPKPPWPGSPRSLIRIVGTVASAYGCPTCHCSRISARCSLRSRARALAAANSLTGGGTNGENAGSRCATPSMIWPSTSRPEEPGVLAHQPVPVVAALGVGVGDTDQRPVDRDLLRPQRVGAQRPAPGLDDAGDRGDSGDVGEAGDPLGVPALAEQGAGADQHLACGRPGSTSSPGRPSRGSPTGRPGCSGVVEPGERLDPQLVGEGPVRAAMPGTPGACPARRPRSAR